MIKNKKYVLKNINQLTSKLDNYLFRVDNGEWQNMTLNQINSAIKNSKIEFTTKWIVYINSAGSSAPIAFAEKGAVDSVVPIFFGTFKQVFNIHQKLINSISEENNVEK